MWQHNSYNGVKTSGVANAHVMAEEIRNNFGGDFKYVLQSTWNFSRILAVGEKIFNKAGMYWEPQVIDMLSLKLLRGAAEQALREPYSIILSESVAKAFFGDANPMGQTMTINNSSYVKVTGIYEDIPHNSNFREMSWVMPWELYVIESDFIKEMRNPWSNNFTQTCFAVGMCQFYEFEHSRSEKRAKEVGVRKSIGSGRSQLIGQFFTESLLVALLAFVVSLLLVLLALPFFNPVADKKLVLPWHDPLFWMIGIGFSIFTAIIAGSYPALYLSSFRPVKV